MNKIILITLLFLSACSTDNRLENALVMSGSNRAELEKVLEHYSKSEADSLKLRAAKFLIENMPGHYTYEGDEFTTYLKELDSLNPEMPLYEKGYFNSLYYTNNPLRTDQLIKRYDIEHISSDFLIKNIDYKFQVFNGSLFRYGVTFDEFLDYLLPYRIDTEPLVEVNQDTLNKILKSTLDAYKSYDNFNISTHNLIFNIPLTVFNRDQSRIKTPNNEQYSMAGCDAVASNTTEKYRLIGVPITIDFTPHWANYNGRHKWNKVFDISDRSVVLSYANHYKIPKVYRKTYSHNPSPQNDGNFIPFLFDPFSKDVTSEYVRAADVVLSYPECNEKKIKNVYLSVFNNLMWCPVAWSKVDGKGFANFKDMGKGIVYLPVYYEQNDEIISDYPFILTNNGSINRLVPSMERKISITMRRKFPYNHRKISWDKNLIGAQIEASDNRMFNNPDTLLIIKDKAVNSIYNIKINNPKKYKYIRLKNSIMNNRLYLHMYLSELSFFDIAGKRIVCKLYNYDYELLPKLFSDPKKILSDNNYSTYTSAKIMMAEFESKCELSSIHIGIQGDNNDIYPDNVYELMYFDKDGWMSMGVKTASDYFITYDDVPSGALYWLRNLTTGKEERIFTYENGEMKFW